MRPIITKIAKNLLEPTQQETQMQATEHQDIEYCMANTGQFVPIGQHKHIDIDQALEKTKNLDWTFRKNGISFINNKTEDNLFFCRVDSNKWYVDTPIRIQRAEGLFWASFVDESTVKKILELYFAGADWFSATHWHESPDPFEDVTPFGVYHDDW